MKLHNGNFVVLFHVRYIFLGIMHFSALHQISLFFNVHVCLSFSVPDQANLRATVYR